MSGGVRRALGSFGIIVFLAIWTVAAATLGSKLVTWPWWAQAIYYVLAGVVWVVPLRPVFRWMSGP